MPDRVHSGTPLSAVDTAWLHMEDPTNLMMVTGLFVLDRPVSVAELSETLRERMTEAFPRLRHRVRQQGSSAAWIADPSFDVASHVHRVGLPRPGGLEALREVVSDLMSTPLDFSTPLWQCHLVDGVEDGCAVVMRLHHCIGDGLALVHVLLSMTDRMPVVETHVARRVRRTLERHLADQVAWLADKAVASVAPAFRAAQGIGHFAYESLETALHPSRTLDLVRAAAEGARVLYGILARPPDPRTLFKGPLGVAKRAAWSAALPLAEVKAIGHRVGATVNDVLLAAVAGGLRRYLDRWGHPERTLEIHALVPVNLRPPELADDLGNRFGLVYLTLPVGLPNRLARLRLVKAQMDAIKRSPEPLVTFQVLGALGLAPREMTDPLVNLFGSKATAVMTNVIGPKRPIYFCGRRIRDVMFWVPQSGRLGLGVSILSYDGRVRVGVATDVGLVPDPERIAEAFEAEFAGFARWARGLHGGVAATPLAGAGPQRVRRATARRRVATRAARHARG